MVVNGRPMKRMKSRVTADLYDFLSFPSPAPGSGLPLPFRANIKAFLARHALVSPPSSLFPHLMAWQILFRVGEAATEASPDSFPATVYLDVVEEDVARSRSVYCDQCRVVGWSGNPVCSRRYHFIIKADGNSIGGSHKPCTRCGDFQHLSELRCKTCFHVTSIEDVEDWVYHQLEDNTHLLHGVVHSNGYGHLLRVNGREGGSRVLSGCHIMDFWDRLCKTLNVRKISVMDVSKKYGLEYRLLHAITKGNPWYGDWGYEFGAGSFALTLDAYRSAVETISSLALSSILSEGWKLHTRLRDLILFYQSLSENKLVTMRDLFCFLMKLINDAHKSRPVIDSSPYKNSYTSGSGDNRSWTSADVERVEAAMIKVLRAVSGSTWVNSRSLRGAVCKVAPPELLDHCLKELDGKLVAEGMVVGARCNLGSGAIEYRLLPQDVCVTTASQESSPVKYSAVRCPSEDLFMQDFRFLYSSLLHPQFMASYGHDETRDAAMSSAEKLLDCKQFVKDYKAETFSSGSPYPAWSLYCQLELVDQFEDNAPDPPAELLVLSLDATVSDLKQEVAKAYQDVYLSFRKIQVEELVGYSGVGDSTRAKLLFESVGVLRVRARCPGKNVNTKFRLERGVERWIVECSCGAKDDDGERMLACDVCGVWQHTRCSGIHDSIAVPARFVCHRCRGPVVMSLSGGQCKDESMSSVASNSFGKSVATSL